MEAVTAWDVREGDDDDDGDDGDDGDDDDDDCVMCIATHSFNSSPPRCSQSSKS